MKLNHRILQLINYIVPEHKNYIYAVPHPNSKHDCYDLDNCNSDNVLKTIDYFMRMHFDNPVVIYLECYDKSRITYLSEYIAANNKNENLSVRLFRSCLTYEQKYRKPMNLVNHIRRFMCSVWMTDTSSMIFDDKVRKQKLINMNYSTPLKMTPKIFDFSYIDYSYETSLLCAEVHSSLFRIRLENSYSIGFPRNDTIIKSNKADRVRSWLMDKTGIDYKYLLVYAPTYRDYTGAFDSSFLGFEIDDDNMRDFLEKNNIVMVTKYHPLQLNNRFFNSKRVVSYENGYSFSLYDLLAESDALITDYSSVMHDYILSDKPVILNCFDEEMYDATRGFAFEPLKEILPGIQVRNEREFTSAVTTYVINRDEQYNYQTVKSLFHKFTDDKSSKRAAEHIMSIIKEEKSEISPLIPER